jgi:molecular chaperone HtpG
MSSFRFEADVRQILHLVTHSLYSDREIFVRELVSNASDALDRARYEAATRADLRGVDGEPGVRITVDKDARTITVSDDGIGLTAEEATAHLGTIAKSGTKAFAAALKAKGDEAASLIGQFGVGFYSAFMVADRVVVESLSARPEAGPIRWESDGGEDYTLGEGSRTARGTDIVLYLREEAAEFLEADHLRDIVRKHSGYVAWPVLVEGERANAEAALWTRAPSEVSDDEYKAFYKSVSGDWQDPLGWLHIRAEGTFQYQAVLFIPKTRPWEMDRMDYKVGVQLFQKRVKILDHADALLPRYLRFVSGVVDAPELDLNVSRELLQQTPMVTSIKKQLTKRLLKKLAELGRTEGDAFSTAWKEWGHILKEGVHEDADQRDLLTEIVRWPTTTSEGALRTLADLAATKKDGQDALWYYCSVDKERIGQAAVLEGFKKRDWEVLLMADPVDEWVVMQLREHGGTPLKSVMVGDLPKDDAADPVADEARKAATPLVGWMKGVFGGSVQDVRLSARLTDSPSVLVDAEGGVGSNLERILKAANQDAPMARRVLEINPEHPMVRTLARLNDDGVPGLEPFARLLLDHAAIAEGRLDDPSGFARRLQTVMEKAAIGLAAGKGGPPPAVDPEIVGGG